MKNIVKLLKIYVFSVFFASCVSDKTNFVVLVDLSSLHTKSNEQIQKDKNLLYEVFEQYKKAVQINGFISPDNVFKILVVSDNENILKITSQLKINLKDTLAEKRKKCFEQFKQQYAQKINDLYKELPKKDASNICSFNIWHYIDTKLSNEIDKNKNYAFFVLTDGYFCKLNTANDKIDKNRHNNSNFMEDLRNTNWKTKLEQEDYGIIKTRKKFSNLCMLIMGLSPKNQFLEEYFLLENIWEKWLDEMQPKKYEINARKPLKEEKKIIQNFVDNLNNPHIQKEKIDIINESIFETKINLFLQEKDTTERTKKGNEIIKKFANRYVTIKLTYNKNPKPGITIEDYIKKLLVIPTYKKYKIEVLQIQKDAHNYIKSISINETRK